MIVQKLLQQIRRIPHEAEAPVAKSAEWESLFDGKTLNGWHGFNKKGDSIRNWTIEDGAMVCLGAAKDAHGGDIVSDKEYGNFELTWGLEINERCKQWCNVSCCGR